MGTKILVYDNQHAYFGLLKTAFLHKYQFVLSEVGKLESADSEVDMIVFLLYDEIELLDFVKLYRQDMPVILGLSGMNKPNNFATHGNIHYLNLNKLKNEIINDITMLLEMLLQKI